MFLRHLRGMQALELLIVAAVGGNLPSSAMDVSQISELLKPFLRQPLSSLQLQQISTYIDLLLRWNRKLNLTAIRDEEHIVTRHFGESIFAAQYIFPTGSGHPDFPRVVDVGSGAGFPGLPLKLWAPQIKMTLIESTQKKATFLREAIRALSLAGTDVFADRAEKYPPASADLVIVRAVEHFESTLQIASRLVANYGRIALLIGESQKSKLVAKSDEFSWSQPAAIPLSSARILQVGLKKRP